MPGAAIWRLQTASGRGKNTRTQNANNPMMSYYYFSPWPKLNTLAVGTRTQTARTPEEAWSAGSRTWKRYSKWTERVYKYPIFPPFSALRHLSPQQSVMSATASSNELAEAKTLGKKNSSLRFDDQGHERVGPTSVLLFLSPCPQAWPWVLLQVQKCMTERILDREREASNNRKRLGKRHRERSLRRWPHKVFLWTPGLTSSCTCADLIPLGMPKTLRTELTGTTIKVSSWLLAGRGRGWGVGTHETDSNSIEKTFKWKWCWNYNPQKVSSNYVLNLISLTDHKNKKQKLEYHQLLQNLNKVQGFMYYPECPG